MATAGVRGAHRYGAPGETLRYVRNGGGHVTKVVMGGVSMYPVESYRARQ